MGLVVVSLQLLRCLSKPRTAGFPAAHRGALMSAFPLAVRPRMPRPQHALSRTAVVDGSLAVYHRLLLLSESARSGPPAGRRPCRGDTVPQSESCHAAGAPGTLHHCSGATTQIAITSTPGMAVLKVNARRLSACSPYLTRHEERRVEKGSHRSSVVSASTDRNCASSPRSDG